MGPTWRRCCPPRHAPESRPRASSNGHVPEVPVYDLIDDAVQPVFDLPFGKLRVRLRQVGDVADVVPLAVLLDILISQAVAQPCQEVHSLENREAVCAAAPDVVYLPGARMT